ncbi:hypothetical protein BDZ91DRAFT_783383 [Kalaharituber pfeilii]|nr:hypothetical protein BDZ91DRAFT_783383 [Kalaharituber pfeilii]
MSSLRLGKQSLLQSKPAKEKPVEKSEKALFGRSLMPRIPENIIPGSSSKSKSDKEKVTEDAEAESGMKLDPKWFTLVENVIAYLTSLLPSKRSGPADPHQAERLKCIGKILDSLHCRTEGGGFDLQSPVFQPQWERAKYLDQMIANRILLYVIKMPFPQKLEYDTNMALWLNCIKRTDFELLSPADINQVFDIFERTPFGACPSFSEVTWSGKPDGNEDTEDSSSKKTQYLTDLDEDSEDNLLQHLPAPMISRNPIIIGPSGIEALFDIQRVIVTVLKATQVHHQPESEWPQGEALQDVVDNCIRSGNPDTVFTGKCKISTALAYIEVPFRCTAAILKRQLDLHDVLMQTDLRRPDDHQEGGQAYVMTMLQFVQEPDIELVAGEWVLARFSNVPGANWFLCVLEMGATHPYYGWRIPTGKIDFGNAQPEPELIKMWEQYMEHKKNLLCELINTRIKAQKAARNKKQTSAQREKNATLGEVGMDAVSALAKGDTTVPEAVLDAAGKIVQLGSSEIVHALTSYEKRSLMFQEYKERIDLRSRALKAANIPEVAHMAVLSLDDNSVLPAMFFCGYSSSYVLIKLLYGWSAYVIDKPDTSIAVERGSHR